ncbi:hypothetical protein L218DRAFT_962145 [Marasmius fiardii PR-910]|nr:hypothetical protein L218DRAFT_962145 [Marasmius fiardii PR-910]
MSNPDYSQRKSNRQALKDSMGRLVLHTPALALPNLPAANFMWVGWQWNPTSRTLAVVRHSTLRKLSSWTSVALLLMGDQRRLLTSRKSKQGTPA